MGCGGTAVGWDTEKSCTDTELHGVGSTDRHRVGSTRSGIYDSIVVLHGMTETNSLMVQIHCRNKLHRRQYYNSTIPILRQSNANLLDGSMDGCSECFADDCEACAENTCWQMWTKRYELYKYIAHTCLSRIILYILIIYLTFGFLISR